MRCCCDCDDEGLTIEEERRLEAATDVALDLLQMADRLQMGDTGDRPIWLELRLLADALDPMPDRKDEYRKHLTNSRLAMERRRKRETAARVECAFDQAVLAGKNPDDALGDAWRAL